MVFFRFNKHLKYGTPHLTHKSLKKLAFARVLLSNLSVKQLIQRQIRLSDKF